ncbi:hypothetical protein [Actinomyces ruminicola]|uniref:hypothetical protein n=1 Tax=Actinomyces ruminicola TaxID=332524 RepID=UPI0011C80076|nr:hypothetical protein [Actinomyces ruminicola]
MTTSLTVFTPESTDLTIADRTTFTGATQARWPGCRIIYSDDHENRHADCYAYPFIDGTLTELSHFPDSTTIACRGALEAPGIAETIAWIRSLNPDPNLVLWLTDTFFTGHVVLTPGITADEIRASWVDHAEHDPTVEYPEYFGN